MSEIFPVIYLARHGETAWSVTGQHTGVTDLPLTERGERNAVRLGERLAGSVFAKVLTSPLQRATRTCELTGFGAVLCDREQAFLLRAIRQNVDLSDHMQDAVNSLRIVLAADESVRTGKIVTLEG